MLLGEKGGICVIKRGLTYNLSESSPQFQKTIRKRKASIQHPSGLFFFSGATVSNISSKQFMIAHENRSCWNTKIGHDCYSWNFDGLSKPYRWIPLLWAVNLRRSRAAIKKTQKAYYAT